MKPFIDFVLQFGSLNGQQIDLISSKGAELELRKDAYFIEAGKVFKQVGFIVDGIIRPNRKAFQRRDESGDGGNSVVDGKTFLKAGPSATEPVVRSRQVSWQKSSAKPSENQTCSGGLFQPRKCLLVQGLGFYR